MFCCAREPLEADTLGGVELSDEIAGARTQVIDMLRIPMPLGEVLEELEAERVPRSVVSRAITGLLNSGAIVLTPDRQLLLPG